MSETKHSPEPWSARPYGVEAAGVRDANDRIVFEIGGAADARRVVACVNSCAGIPTEALEAGALWEVLAWVADRRAPLHECGCGSPKCENDNIRAALRALGVLK